MEIQTVFYVYKINLCMQIYMYTYILILVNGKARKFNSLYAHFSDTLIKEQWKMIQKQTSNYKHFIFFAALNLFFFF